MRRDLEGGKGRDYNNDTLHTTKRENSTKLNEMHVERDDDDDGLMIGENKEVFYTC